MPAWTFAGNQVITTRLVGPEQIDVPVLDIRQTSEYTAGHLPAAAHIELADLTHAADGASDGPAVLMCGHGERAMTAATLLERTGRRDLAVLVGGPDHWAAATGRRLQKGS